MIEKGRISALQMSMLVYPHIIATAILSVPSITFKSADRDMWLSPIWGSITGFFVVLVLNTAQWLNLSDYKPLALPYGLLLTLFGIWVTPNLAELSNYLSVTSPFITPLFYIVIPVILLVTAVLRNRSRQKV